MNSDLLKRKLRQTSRECASHLQRMHQAHRRLRAFMPVTADTVKALDEEQVASLDQYIYRFTKWQDTMGMRLFPQSLELLAEDTEPAAFIDKLNRLEKLGALRSATEWLELRQLRNTLAHEYSDRPEDLTEGINLLYARFTDLQTLFNTSTRYLAPYLGESSPAPDEGH